MVAAQYRFHGLNALRYVYKQGKTARADGCLLKYALNTQRHHCRIAVVVSKKVSKSAVVRNRLRRQIYAVVETRAGELPPLDLVFTVLDVRLGDKPEKTINNIISQLMQIALTTTQPVEK
jgi:ribonuclease P protein component